MSSNAVVLYMKGDKDFPMCGFRPRAVQILNAVGVDYVTRNVLRTKPCADHQDFSDWPERFPQLYVKGEFVGGSDIMMELYQSGELQGMLPAQA
ncbi:MAG: glutaredoxin domain-containing protein [Caldilineaceae bacterium]